MMSEAEEIGERAVEVFHQNLPTNVGERFRWIPRDLTGRDFGIDIAVEAFVDRSPTGRILLFQLKGKRDSIPWDTNGKYRYSHMVKNLLYAEKFNIPFILCLIELPTNMVYWVWMQEYIRLTLDRDPSWREQTYKDVEFSQEQTLSSSVVKLTDIGAFPQRMALLAGLAGYTRESRARLNAIADSLSFHLNEGGPIDYFMKEFPLFNHYIAQVIENPIWQDRDFSEGQRYFTTSIKPLQESLRDLTDFYENGTYPTGEASYWQSKSSPVSSFPPEEVGPYYLMSRITDIKLLLDRVELMFTTLHDLRLRRNLSDFYNAP